MEAKTLKDEYEVLHKLYRPWQQESLRTLIVGSNKNYYIEVIYTKGYNSTKERYFISESLKNYLLEKGYVLGKPSYSGRSNMEFKLTQLGEIRYFDLVEERKKPEFFLIELSKLCGDSWYPAHI